MSKVPVTVRGHELMKEELKRLKSVDRPNVVKAIAEARAHGDLRENAEYHAAKEQQGFIEARIKDLEGKLSHIQVIDVTAVDARGKIIFGSTVELLEEVERDVRLPVEDRLADLPEEVRKSQAPVFAGMIGLPEMGLDLDGLHEEIGRTLIHEIAHYFGMDDDHIDDLGWG